MKGVDVDLVKDLGDLGLDVLRGVAQHVARCRIERRFAEPTQACIEHLGALRLVVGPHQHVPSAEVDVVGEGHGDAQGWEGLVEGFVAHEDLVDRGLLAAGEGHHLVAGLEDP